MNKPKKLKKNFIQNIDPDFFIKPDTISIKNIDPGFSLPPNLYEKKGIINDPGFSKQSTYKGKALKNGGVAKTKVQQAAIAISMKKTGKIPKPKIAKPKIAKGGSAKSCWPGYEKKGSKTMYGKTYNNCVKK